MKTLIAIPCMDFCHTDFLRALLGLEVSGEVQYSFAQGSLVYDGRNALAAVALEGNFDRVLWLDSDMIFEPSMLKRMHEHLDMGKELVAGLYFSRRPPVHPVIYKTLYSRVEAEGRVSGVADCYTDYPRDEIFPIKACGFGGVLMTTELIRRVQDAFGQPFAPLPGFGEDLSFCARATEVGAELWCDSSIKLGHVGLTVYDEESFRAVSGSNIAQA